MEQNRDPRDKPPFKQSVALRQYKGAKIVYNRWCWNNQTSTCNNKKEKKTNLDADSTSFTKINSKEIIDFIYKM